MRKSFQLFFFSTLSGVLLWLSWPDRGITPIIFFAQVPLLYVSFYFSQNDVKRGAWKVFAHFYWSMLVWNVLTTWWIYNSTDVGSIVAFAVNSLFMATVWQFFFLSKKKLGSAIGYFSLISFWIGFEYLHLHWEISWPWLTLGNVFATHPAYVQWYEFTGTLGGSLWIFIANIFLWMLAKNIFFRDKLLLMRRINAIVAFVASGLLVITPMIFSLWLYGHHTDKGNPVNIVAVQPNIDPYNEKFNGSSDDQLAKMLQLASSASDSATELIMFPETALPDGIWEENLGEHRQIRTIEKFLKAFPKANVLVGVSTDKGYSKNETPSVTARKFSDSNNFYDAYNSAILVNQRNEIQIYHKSRLVPGVEIMPYPKLFGFLEKFAIDLGGTSGSLGIQSERKNFLVDDSTVVTPAICYESIYGDFMSKYMRNGAQLICIITNDGWWGNTAGYRQHMNYARLLAIEFRKSIARSANTGISCFIDQRGDVLEKTEWWKEDVIKHTLYKNDIKTFYAKHGDYIGKIFSALSGLLLILLLVGVFRRKQTA